MFRIASKTLTAALTVTVCFVQAGNAQNVSAGLAASEAPWVVSVVQTIDVQKLVQKMRQQQNARVGVAGSSPDVIFSVATGLVVDQEGHVVTRLVNIDPLDKDLKLAVTTSVGQSLPAKLIGIDLPTGFAILEVTALKVGPPTFAPITSDRQISVAIVSSDVERTANTRSGRVSFVPTMKKLKGEIRPGNNYSRARGVLSLRAVGLLSCNDGSVVIDEAGKRVIGMAQYAGYGRGYFFPIEFISGTVAKRVLERNDNVPAGWLGVKGVSAAQLTEGDLAALGLAQKMGFVVKDVVPNSPAVASGMKPNDVIVEVEDLNISGEADLSALIASSPAGRKLRVRAIRNHQAVEMSIVLAARAASMHESSAFFPTQLLSDQMEGSATAQLEQIQHRLEELNTQFKSYLREQSSRERDEAIREIKLEMNGLAEKQRALAAQVSNRNDVGSPSREIGPSEVLRFSFGFMARDLSGQLANYFGVRNGVWVIGISEDSPAERAGLKPGDVITSARGRAFTTARQLQTLLSTYRGRVSLRVIRDRQPIIISLAE